MAPGESGMRIGACGFRPHPASPAGLGSYSIAVYRCKIILSRAG
jgi:hypothetical protein